MLWFQLRRVCDAPPTEFALPSGGFGLTGGRACSYNEKQNAYLRDISYGQRSDFIVV